MKIAVLAALIAVLGVAVLLIACSGDGGSSAGEDDCLPSSFSTLTQEDTDALRAQETPPTPGAGGIITLDVTEEDIATVQALALRTPPPTPC